MRISLFLLLFILVGCGKEVNLDTSKMESTSKIVVPDQSGTLVRAQGGDTLTANGRSYKVSIYSSYNALEFVAAKPIPTTMGVRFKGKQNPNDSNEIVLEVLENP